MRRRRFQSRRPSRKPAPLVRKQGQPALPADALHHLLHRHMVRLQPHARRGAVEELQAPADGLHGEGFAAQPAEAALFQPFQDRLPAGVQDDVEDGHALIRQTLDDLLEICWIDQRHGYDDRTVVSLIELLQELIVEAPPQDHILEIGRMAFLRHVFPQEIARVLRVVDEGVFQPPV